MMAPNTNTVVTPSSSLIVVIVGVASLLLSIIVTEDGSTVHAFVFSNTCDIFTKEKGIRRQKSHKHRHPWWKRSISSSSSSVLRESSIEYYDSLNNDIHQSRRFNEEGTDGDLTMTITTMMTRMMNFFSSMVDPSTNRFYYLYRYQQHSPQYHHQQQQQRKNEFQQQQQQQQHEDLEQFLHHHVPIRDLAASWDASKAIQFFYTKNDDDDINMDATTATTSIPVQYRTDNERRLLEAIQATLRSYQLSQSSSSISSSTGWNFIDSSDLADGETPTIGHSSMWILGAIGWKRIYDCHQQRKVQQGSVLTRTGNNDRSIQSDIASSCSSSVIDMTTLRSNIISLVEGILKQQNDNGSFRINFVLEDHHGSDTDGNMDDIQEGIEFFPGEAMLALMEVYHESSSPSFDRQDRNNSLVDETTCQSICKAMTKAFDFYSSYHDEHKQRLGTNYNIWQIQSFSRFCLALNDNNIQNDDTIDETDRQHFMDRLYEYITTLCDDIVSSPTWKQLNRGQSFYRNLQTLEIVCGLDALLDGLSVVEDTNIVKSYSTCNTGSSSTDDENNNNNNNKDDTEHKDDDERIRLYRLHAMNAIDFVKWAQDQTINLNGGLGYGGLQVTEQRLDVTGHAISALSKASKLII